MKFRDLPAAQFGRFGESIVARIVRELGAGVVPSFKFSGENDDEAPAIEFEDRRIVSADLDVSDPRGLLPNPLMRKQRSELEVKTYREPKFNRENHCLVHGVPLRLIDQYEESARLKMTHIYLAVLEVESGALLVSNLPISQITPRYPCLCGCENDPAKCEWRAEWGNSYPQWYFRRDCFTEWYRLASDDHERLKSAHNKISHALRRHGEKREPIDRKRLFGDDTHRASNWTMTCLPCDSTWIGKAEDHRCTNAADWRRDSWIQRLRWTMPAASRDELAALIGKPIARSRLVELLGPRWAVSKDVA